MNRGLRNIIGVLTLLLLLVQLAPVNAQGTNPQLVKDLLPGAIGSNPVHFMPYQNKALFFADNSSGKSDLWVTDGTTEGTQILKTGIEAEWLDSPNPSGEYKGILYFAAKDDEHGNELWRSDGTPGGTYLFDNIDGSTISRPANFIVYNDLLYFSYDSSYIGTTDGTPEGTTINIMGGKRIRSAMVPYNGNLYAIIYNLMDDTDDLIRVASGDNSPSAHPESYSKGNIAVFKGYLYFSNPDDNELWRMGPEEDQNLFKNIEPNGMSFPYGFFIYQNMLFFQAITEQNGSELWRTDGSAAGTKLFLDLAPGMTNSSPNFVSIVGATSTQPGRLVFSANQNQLWSTDGTSSNTVFLGDLMDHDHRSLYQFNNILYYTGSDHNLWRTDGTAASTRSIAAIGAYPVTATDSTIIRCGEKICFTAGDALHGRELWVYTPPNPPIYLPFIIVKP